MSISRVSLALGLALAAPLALAANPVGHWTGKMMIKMPPVPANAPAQQKAMMQKIMTQMASARIMLDLKPNKTFTVSMNGMPQAGAKTESGNWSQKGNVVTTTQSKPGSKPQSMTLSPDGKKMILVIPGGQGSVVFTK